MWARRTVSETTATAKQQGDLGRANAFRRVAENSLPDAYRLAGAILRDPAEAEDAVQDAFVKAWLKWSTLRDQSKFEPWFKRIVVNVCRERLRRGARRPSANLAASAGISAPDPSLDVHDRLLLEQSLTQLQPDDRVILALRYYQDLKVDDMAVILGLRAGTVKSRLHRALTRLRAVIESSQRDGVWPCHRPPA
jgi:RNA polymerase sigma-70 factor (ECF subfamily)